MRKYYSDGLDVTPVKDAKQPTKGSMQWFQLKQQQWNNSPRNRVIALTPPDQHHSNKPSSKATPTISFSQNGQLFKASPQSNFGFSALSSGSGTASPFSKTTQSPPLFPSAKKEIIKGTPFIQQQQQQQPTLFSFTPTQTVGKIPEPSQKDSLVVSQNATSMSHRERLIEFYRKHNPSKLDTVDSTLASYRGKEDLMFRKLEEKYIISGKDGMLPPSGTGPCCFLDFQVDGVSVGRVVVKLYRDKAPIACENFRCLCTGEKGRGQSGKDLYFRGCKIHRVVPNFCIQGGDFTKGDGTGGESIYPPGSEHGDMWGKFKDETPFMQHSKKGLLSMANNGPNRNGSQFFITLKATPHLDGKHVVFGEVVEGMDVVELIGKVETDAKQRPLKTVVIEGCGELGGDMKKIEKPMPASTTAPSHPFGLTTSPLYIATPTQQSSFAGQIGSSKPSNPATFSFSAPAPAAPSPFGIPAQPQESSPFIFPSASLNNATDTGVAAGAAPSPFASFSAKKEPIPNFSFGLNKNNEFGKAGTVSCASGPEKTDGIGKNSSALSVQQTAKKDAPFSGFSFGLGVSSMDPKPVSATANTGIPSFNFGNKDPRNNITPTSSANPLAAASVIPVTTATTSSPFFSFRRMDTKSNTALTTTTGPSPFTAAPTITPKERVASFSFGNATSPTPAFGSEPAKKVSNFVGFSFGPLGSSAGTNSQSTETSNPSTEDPQLKATIRATRSGLPSFSTGGKDGSLLVGQSSTAAENTTSQQPLAFGALTSASQSKPTFTNIIESTAEQPFGFSFGENQNISLAPGKSDGKTAKNIFGAPESSFGGSKPPVPFSFGTMANSVPGTDNAASKFEAHATKQKGATESSKPTLPSFYFGQERATPTKINSASKPKVEISSTVSESQAPSLATKERASLEPVALNFNFSLVVDGNTKQQLQHAKDAEREDNLFPEGHKQLEDEPPSAANEKIDENLSAGVDERIKDNMTPAVNEELEGKLASGSNERIEDMSSAVNEELEEKLSSAVDESIEEKPPTPDNEKGEKLSPLGGERLEEKPPSANNRNGEDNLFPEGVEITADKLSSAGVQGTSKNFLSTVPSETKDPRPKADTHVIMSDAEPSVGDGDVENSSGDKGAPVSCNEKDAENKTTGLTKSEVSVESFSSAGFGSPVTGLRADKTKFNSCDDGAEQAGSAPQYGANDDQRAQSQSAMETQKPTPSIVTRHDESKFRAAPPFNVETTGVLNENISSGSEQRTPLEQRAPPKQSSPEGANALDGQRRTSRAREKAVFTIGKKRLKDVTEAVADILAERVFSDDDLLSQVTVEQVEKVMALPVDKMISILEHIDAIESRREKFTWNDIEAVVRSPQAALGLEIRSFDDSTDDEFKSCASNAPSLHSEPQKEGAIRDASNGDDDDDDDDDDFVLVDREVEVYVEATAAGLSSSSDRVHGKGPTNAAASRRRRSGGGTREDDLELLLQHLETLN